MKQQDREELMRLLTELIHTQDRLSCTNESIERTADLVAARSGAKDNILNYVDEMCDKACEECQ